MARIYAVDLGARSVKVAVATPGMRGAVVTNLVERAITPGGNWENDAVAAVSAIVDELGLRDATCYLGVYGDHVFTHIVDLPMKGLRRADLNQAVGAELENLLPVDLEDLVYTYAELPAPPAPPAAAEGATPMRGRVAAAPTGTRLLTYSIKRERAEQLMELIRRATGNEPRGILPVGGAAVRLVEKIPSLTAARATGTIAVVDIGHDRTDVVLVAGGKAVFSRSLPRAGRHVTDVIARHWRLETAAAEAAKHSDGFIASNTEPAQSEAWARISQVIVAELTPFARDLRQTFAAARARTGFYPEAALVVGGGARLRGIVSFLGEQLGMPAWGLAGSDVAAVIGPKLAEAGGADAAATTIGVLLDAGAGRPLFDLRQGALAAKVDLSFLRAKAVPLAAGAIAICGFAALSAWAHLYSLHKAEKTLLDRVATESAELYNGQKKTVDEILNGPSGAGGASASASPIPKWTSYDLLLEMSNKVPAKGEITLDMTKVDIQDSKIDIEGNAKTPVEVDNLEAALKKSDCFKDISRGPSESGPNGTRSFRFTIKVGCI